MSDPVLPPDPPTSAGYFKLVEIAALKARVAAQAETIETLTRLVERVRPFIEDSVEWLMDNDEDDEVFPVLCRWLAEARALTVEMQGITTPGVENLDSTPAEGKTPNAEA